MWRGIGDRRFQSKTYKKYKHRRWLINFLFVYTSSSSIRICISLMRTPECFQMKNKNRDLELIPKLLFCDLGFVSTLSFFQIHKIWSLFPKSGQIDQEGRIPNSGVSAQMSGLLAPRDKYEELCLGRPIAMCSIINSQNRS